MPKGYETPNNVDPERKRCAWCNGNDGVKRQFEDYGSYFCRHCHPKTRKPGWEDRGK